MTATQLVVLQAHSREALLAEARQLVAACAADPGRPLADIAVQHWPAAVSGPHRLAAVATGVADLGRIIGRVLDGSAGTGRGRGRAGRSAVHLGSGPVGEHGRVAWLFPGEGAQYAGMLTDLCVRFPSARHCFDLLDRAVAGDPPPSREIFGPTTGSAGALWQMGAAVAAVLTANRAVASVLHALGVPADAVVGHSTGEYSALLEAGALDVTDDDSLIEQFRLGEALSRRLEARDGIPTGSLLTITLVEEPVVHEVLHRHAGSAWLALDNCPAQRVVFVTPEAEASVIEGLRAAGALVQPLPFGRAYHTPLFAVLDDELRALLGRLPLRAPDTEVWSSATAAPYPEDLGRVRELLVSQWSSTVRFRETVLALHGAGVRVFVEAGPRGNLRQFVADTLGDRPHLALATDHHLVPGLTQLQHLAAALVAAGVPLDLGVLRPQPPTRSDAPPLRLGLPVLRLTGAAAPATPPPPTAPLSPTAPPVASPPLGAAASGHLLLDLRSDPWLRDHSLGGQVSERDRELTALVVVPLTVSLELLARAAMEARPGQRVRALREVRAHRWLVVPDDEPLPLAVRAGPGPGAHDVTVQLCAADGAPAVEAVVELGVPPLPNGAAPLAPTGGTAYPWRADELYLHGMFHGPAFRGVASIDRVADGGATATVEVPAELPGPAPVTAPVHADAAGQLVGFWAAARLVSGFAVFPRRIDRVELADAPLPVGAPLHASLRVREVTEDSVLADLELRDAAQRRVWHAAGWEDSRARVPAALLRLRIDPAGTMLSEDWPWPPLEAGELICRRVSLAQRLPAADDGFWLDVLASLVLSRDERHEWRRVRSTRRAQEWLGGRVAVKDAARRCLDASPREPPADLRVVVDRFGAPRLAERDVAVSITHRGPWAVAVAAAGARGVGVDVELLSRHPTGLGQAVLSPGEAEAAGTGPVGGEVAMRLWCAKEAAAKALGHGLPAGPGSLLVVETDPDASRVRLVAGRALLDLDPGLADAELTAHTTRDQDLVAAIARR